jgi:hypothetical protein
VLEVAARQRTLSERYLQEVLLARQASRPTPPTSGLLLDQSARTLLDGGKGPGRERRRRRDAPSAASGTAIRAQLRQERKLIRDLRASGAAYVAGRPVGAVRLDGG